MSVIHILPISLQNKIAAGEVIERPASVVKELIENSIDAKCTEIRIDIQRGGKNLIRVSDNGIGMDRDDALLCFQRHATSKISKDTDLFNLKTLGFRGEALSSIASVSRVKMITGLKGSTVGISIEIEGGNIRDIKESAFSGTLIEVKDLFFNTPARKKFLKTDQTELFHIIDTITREALSHSFISFTVRTDGHETMNLPVASSLKERIMQIYGAEFIKGLTEVHTEEQGMKINMFVSKIDNFRNTKSHQFIFVNRRPVHDKTVNHAIYKAYEGILPKEKHPIFLVFLEIDPSMADFNVHPAKRELRFDDRETVYRFLYRTVKNAVSMERESFVRQFAISNEQSCSVPLSALGSYTHDEDQENVNVAENLELMYRTSIPFIYLGDTFVAVSGLGGLTIVDYHAAHERVLYEKIIKGVNNVTMQLLFPKQLRLAPGEYNVLLQNKNILVETGFDIEDFGHNTILVRAVPSECYDSDIYSIMSDIAAGIIEGKGLNKPLKEEIAARVACHSSIRGRRMLSKEELSGLLDDLEKTDHPDQCPHGRPTRIFISLDELNRLFKRK